MTRKSAPVKNTGGGGFTFADKVAARFLVDMLSRGFPFEVKAGFPIRLDWEAKDLGWHIDDLLLRLYAAGGQEVVAAVSVKSNGHLKSSGFSSPFVQDAWSMLMRNERSENSCGMTNCQGCSSFSQRHGTDCNRICDTEKSHPS
jgi:hypothetical protein